MFITEDSKHVTIFGSKMGIFSVYLDKINLADVNFDENNAETIIHVKLLHNKLDIINLKNAKNIKNIYKKRINACSISSYNILGLVLTR